MAQAYTTERTAPAIPIARGGPLTDQMLETILPQARRAPYELDQGFGELMLVTYAPLIEELLQRRRAMALIADVANPDNVVELYPGEAT